MESERPAESPLLAAIRGFRDEIDRLIEEQKLLLSRTLADREAEPAAVLTRSPAPAVAPPAPSKPTPTPTPPKPPLEPGPADSGDDIGRRLKELSSRLERLRSTSNEAAEVAARPVA
ncbi:MAG: hypothetical protein K2X91_05315 [Thermoleophilia bacterium]|nr:hypothetical protein [Thermoleophilia bacterium]